MDWFVLVCTTWGFLTVVHLIGGEVLDEWLSRFSVSLRPLVIVFETKSQARVATVAAAGLPAPTGLNCLFNSLCDAAWWQHHDHLPDDDAYNHSPSVVDTSRSGPAQDPAGTPLCIPFRPLTIESSYTQMENLFTTKSRHDSEDHRSLDHLLIPVHPPMVERDPPGCITVRPSLPPSLPPPPPAPRAALLLQ
jgi:hypothetical protein